MHALKSFLASLLRGGREPRHIFIAVFLGFTAGAVSGWNLTFAAFVCAAALLNCSTSLLAVSASCGYLAAFAGSSVTRSVGVLLLDQLGLSAYVAKLGTGPFVALFGLDDYTTFGSLALGLALSIPVAQVFSRFAVHRRGLLNLAVARMSGTREPIVRPLGWAAATCCALSAAMLVQVQGPRLVGRSLLEHLSAVLQTEVTADVVSYDLWNGDLHVTNLRVADAEHSSDVALVVEGVSARVEPGLLLRGRFSCDDMTVAGLFCDPTKLSQAAPAGMFSRGPTLLKEDRLQPSHNEDPLRTVEIQSLVRNWPGLCDRLFVVQRLVSFVERIADLETSTATSKALKSFVEARRAPRDPVSGTAVPLVQVRHITIDRLPSTWKLSAQSSLSLTDLSSCPSLASRPARLTFQDEERQVALHTTFQTTAEVRRHEITLEAKNLSLESVLAGATTRSTLEPLSSGLTSFEGSGWISREELDVDVTCTLQGLQIATTSGPLAGIDSVVWRQGLQRLGEIRVEANVAGRWSNPKCTLVPAEVVQQFKQNLQAAGAGELVLAFDTNKPASASSAMTQKTLATHDAAKELAPQVPPYSASASQLPQPTSPIAGSTKGKQLSSGLAAATQGGGRKPVSTAVAAPTQPLTIEPMATAQSSTLPQSVSPTSTPAAASTSPTQKPPAASGTIVAAKAPAITPPVTSLTQPAVASAQVPASPIKALSSETFAVGTGEPWKEPKVVLGTATPAIQTAATQRPATTLTAQVPRPAIGIASDVPSSTKPIEGPKAAPIVPQEIASQTSPTMGMPQAPLKPKSSEPSTVAPIPTSAVATAGLRQPLSVLDPSAAPGPINLTVGYDSDRALAAPSEATVKKPQPQTGVDPSELDVTRPPTKPLAQESNRNRPLARDQLAAKSPNGAAKPPIADDDYRSEVPFSEDAPKEKKSIIGNITGWFGFGPKPERSATVEGPASDLETADRDSQSQASSKSAPTMPTLPKKMFPRLRAMFGEEVETLPPDEAELPLDRNVVPSAAIENDSVENVRPSSFDASSRELPSSDAAPAELASGTEKQGRALPRAGAEPRELNVPRPNATGGQASDTELAKNKTSAAAKATPKGSERMSAGESFYNRTVR